MEKIITIPIEYKRLFDKDWREASIYGGRYSMKSHTVARYLLIQARMEKTRIGCFREFQNSITESSHQLLSDLIKEYELHDFEVTNNSIVNKITGSDFLFKGLWHNEQSIKSIEGIDIAWVEEAQTVSNNSIEVLTPTVRKPGSRIIYTYNRLLEDDPVHQRLVLEGRPNTLIINVNYDIALKYKLIPDVILAEIEDDKANRPSLFKQKWLGEPTSAEKKIYKDWNFIDNLPFEARLFRRGVDFGYTNDPTAVVSIYQYNGGYILEEEVYQKGLSNQQIANILLNLPKGRETLIIADSAEPKSIDELKSYGLTILPCIKGNGSITAGIQFLQNQKISVTKKSRNITDEYKRYMWEEDRNGRTINVPIDRFNHCFHPDTLVYTTHGEIKIKDLEGKSGFVYSRNGTVRKFTDVRQTRYKSDMVRLYFDDGKSLSVTPDHLLLQPNGEWIEASLLSPMDLIQSVTYGTNIQRQSLQTISWREIFQSWTEEITQGYMGGQLWDDTEGLSHSPQRREAIKQLYKQFRIKINSFTSKRAYDTRKKAEVEGKGRDNKTPNKEMALIRRGEEVAQIAWYRNLQEKKTSYKKLCSLWQRIYDFTIVRKCKILPPELQNESKTKKIERIEREFCPITYNLDVEDTECLLADGVIAHNCMDAIRYALHSETAPNQFISKATVSYPKF